MKLRSNISHSSCTHRVNQSQKSLKAQNNFMISRNPSNTQILSSFNLVNHSEHHLVESQKCKKKNNKVQIANNFHCKKISKIVGKHKIQDSKENYTLNSQDQNGSSQKKCTKFNSKLT